MLESLPDQPLEASTVESLPESDAVEDTMVLCGMGWGEDLVIQFGLQTESAVHVLCYAAPADDQHDGWFKLDTVEETGMDGYAEASQIAADYMEDYDISSFLQDQYDTEMEEGDVIEAQTKI